MVRFSDETKTETVWWKDNIRLSFNDIDSSHGETDFIIFSDMSWRPATQEAYNCYIKKWEAYAMSHSISLLQPSSVDVANFLAHLFTKGASHSAINIARSALSPFLTPHQDGPSIESHPEVCRKLKGLFESRPALPRYNHTRDVDTVLDYLSAMPDIDDMSLKELTL